MRTKRNYDGVIPTGKKMSDLLPQVMQEIHQKRGDDRERIFQFWFSLIGEKMAMLTQPISLKNGVLTIKVKSATLYALLCRHEKERLLKTMQEKFPLHDLSFKVG